MSDQLQIQNSNDADVSLAYSPKLTPKQLVRTNKRTGQVQYKRNGIWINSALRKDEWKVLDAAVIEAAGARTELIARLPQQPLGGIGTMVSQWNISSQMTAANVSITGRAVGESDRVDYNLAGTPIPVIWKNFNIGARELQASRDGGDALDITHAYEAGRVVAEKRVNMLYLGDSNIVLNGSTIFGLTNETNVTTGTAAGDFGTIANIRITVLSMISAAAAKNYFGPFELHVATTQYIEMLARYTDGSGQTALDAVLSLPQISAVVPADQMIDGTLVLFQPTRNVVDWASAMDITLVEWLSGDGMTHYFRVMTIGAPRVKSDYNGNSGIVYFTGA